VGKKEKNQTGRGNQENELAEVKKI